MTVSSFSPHESLSVFVPQATSCRNEGLDMNSRKWSTLGGSSLGPVMIGWFYKLSRLSPKRMSSCLINSERRKSWYQL